MDLTIDYCEECGHLGKALEVVESVMPKYSELEKAEIVPAENGVLRVSIDGEILFDMEEERFSTDKIQKNIGDYLQDSA